MALAVLVVIGVFAFIMFKNRKPETSSFSTAEQTSQENKVTYTNSGYSPSELKVEVGATVTFINQSDSNMWTASNPHPIHTDHPAFDSRRAVTKGETYEFTFEETGTYDYHNHLSPQHEGTIKVE